MLDGDTDLAGVFSYVVAAHYILLNLSWSNLRAETSRADARPMACEQEKSRCKDVKDASPGVWLVKLSEGPDIVTRDHWAIRNFRRSECCCHDSITSSRSKDAVKTHATELERHSFIIPSHLQTLPCNAH